MSPLLFLGLLIKRAKTILKKDDIASDPISLKDIVKISAQFLALEHCLCYILCDCIPLCIFGTSISDEKIQSRSSRGQCSYWTCLFDICFCLANFGIYHRQSWKKPYFCSDCCFFYSLGTHDVGIHIWNPYIPICVMGMSYSLLASALWPICTLIVPIERLGTAFGIMQAIQNLGLAIVPLGAGVIVDNYGYIWLEIYFIFWLTIAIIATLTMWLIDLNFNDSFLNMDAGTRNARTEALKKTDAP
ncbi:unnamed protein product [Lepeophtheirus salmonis]|uniref:Lysosomal dipeptide transporter MFSD1 n=1 Tax=Lepeophtheirus salmonis TaxID=72036 RepID=A0A7R8H6K2_LEPSM|nr:unnamed protein product [Lepeophtheirus salmonis]CAF2900949.1 unnamed protein product [Lepeophtheirus salmonis]